MLVRVPCFCRLPRGRRSQGCFAKWSFHVSGIGFRGFQDRGILFTSKSCFASVLTMQTGSHTNKDIQKGLRGFLDDDGLCPPRGYPGFFAIDFIRALYPDEWYGLRGHHRGTIVPPPPHSTHHSTTPPHSNPAEDYIYIYICVCVYVYSE